MCEQLFEADRELADAHTGGMVDGVGDRRIGADVAELANALDAERIDLAVLLGEEDHLCFDDVGVGRDQVLGKVGISVMGGPTVARGRLAP
jgi:hypothetical protein